MAQIVVNSTVMRDKAQIIQNAATSIQTLYAEMLQDVNTTASKMKGDTIETQKKQFANMHTHFETFAKDINAYATFLNEAAEEYDRAESEGKQKAEAQGKIF